MAPDRPQVDTVNTVCHYCHYRGASHPDQELLTLAGVSGDASECASRLFTLESKHRKRKLGQYFVATKVVRFSPSRTPAPWGPPTIQRVARNACKIKARWESKYVLGAGGTVTEFVSDSFFIIARKTSSQVA